MEKLVKAGLRNPVLVSVKDKEGSTLSTPSSLENYFTIISKPQDKLAVLVKFLETTEKCIVFFSTCACVEYFETCITRLTKGHHKVFAIHGKKGNKRRVDVFQDFKKIQKGILLCTDVMARGM